MQRWGMGKKGEGIVSLSKNSKQNKFKSETKTLMFSGLVNGVLMTGPNMVTQAVFFLELILSKIVQNLVYGLSFLLLMMEIKFLLLEVIYFRAGLKSGSGGEVYTASSK